MKNIIKVASWEISKKCNLTCKHCVAQTNFLGPELSLSERIRLIDTLAKNGFEEINITGGEPLFVEGFNKILAAAKKHNMKVNLITNAIFIDKQSLGYLKGNIGNILISLDGITSRENDLVRGKGNYEKAIRSIKMLQKSGMNFGISYTYFGTQSIEKLITHSESLGASFVKINQLIKKGRAIDNWNELHKGKEMGPSNKNYHVLNGCDIADDSLFISPTGDAYSCIEIYQNNPLNKLGNFLTDGSKEIFAMHTKNVKRSSYLSCPYTVYVSESETITKLKKGGSCELSKKYF